ncbi:MAG TPA: VWA domain-containing protein, partial [Terriglobia bacterium]|nr:VWA domain-containing protein [Terriglobia bacterium]
IMGRIVVEQRLKKAKASAKFQETKMARKQFLAGVALLLTTLTCVTSAQDQIFKTPTLKMDVDLVLVNATVTESGRNRTVTGLDQKDFRVWEDKIEQKIAYFSSEGVPVSVGIIFDISGSMKDKINSARNAAATFIKSGTREDEYFEIQFSDRPQVVSDFTTDVTKLQNRLLSTPTKGSTALYDAVYLGLNKLKESNNPKKALLLITDGEDNRSRYSYSNVRDFMREQDVQLYAIGILDPATGVGRDPLVQLTEITGGRAFFPNAAFEMPDICKKIATELKNQYVIGYHSTNSAKDGALRKIKVTVSTPKGRDLPQLNVRAKQSYFAPTGDEPPAGKK